MNIRDGNLAHPTNYVPGSSIVLNEMILNKEHLKFNWDPNTQQLTGAVERLGKMGDDTGRMIQDFFDNLKIRPGERMGLLIRGILFTLGGVFGTMGLNITLPLIFGDYLQTAGSGVSLVFILTILTINILFWPLLMHGIITLLILRKNSFESSQYKMMTRLYKEGLLEILRLRGIDLSWRIVSSSPIFQFDSNVKKFVFTFKLLDREADVYIGEERKGWCPLISHYVKRLIYQIPYYELRSQKMAKDID
jgi:hypothetical protein